MSDFLRGVFPGAFAQFHTIKQVHQVTAVAAESRLVNGLILGSVILPAAPDDPLPFEGERPHGRVVRRAPGALLQVIRPRPPAVVDALPCELMEALPVKLRTAITPVNALAAAALLCHRRHARVALDLRRVVTETFAVGAQGAQQPRPQHRPRPGQ